jgi:hypothetical protein
VKTVARSSFFVMLAAFAALAVGCTPRPQAKLVAVDGVRFVESTTTVMVLVEIENPTNQTLMLSGLDYQVDAKDWFTARGSYALSRFLVPGDVAYIEVPLPVKNFDMALGAADAALNGVRFKLDGRLRALRAKGGEIAWDVHQEGALAPIVNVRGRIHRDLHPMKPQIKVHVSVGS